jgi:hypothetical protein
VNLLVSKDALTYRAINLPLTSPISEKSYDPSDEAEYNRIAAQRQGETVDNEFPEFDAAAFIHEGDLSGVTPTNNWQTDLEIQR